MGQGVYSCTEIITAIPCPFKSKIPPQFAINLRNVNSYRSESDYGQGTGAHRSADPGNPVTGVSRRAVAPVVDPRRHAPATRTDQAGRRTCRHIAPSFHELRRTGPGPETQTRRRRTPPRHAGA